MERTSSSTSWRYGILRYGILHATRAFYTKTWHSRGFQVFPEQMIPSHPIWQSHLAELWHRDYGGKGAELCCKINGSHLAELCSRVNMVIWSTTGESGGLRIPRAGLDRARRPCWLAFGALFCSARPNCDGSGADALEVVDGIPVAVARLIGADALERASFLRKVKREEKYQRSSLEALSKPPPTGVQPVSCLL